MKTTLKQFKKIAIYHRDYAKSEAESDFWREVVWAIHYELDWAEV